MAWIRLTAQVRNTEAEALSDALMHEGALSVTIEQDLSLGQPEVAVFGEPGESPGLWPQCVLDALLPLSTPVEPLMQRASATAGLQEVPAYHSDFLADQDWVGLTQRQFNPIAVTPGLWIVPSWHVPPDPKALNIRLDPGQAFGTGSHPTTQLCLHWLATHPLAGLHLLDYGCGSGILAIAASLLGARHVLGVDIDPAAVETARANARHNGAQANFQLPQTSLPTATFDVVVANILAAPLVLLAPLLASCLKPGGRIVLSGILERQAEEVIAAYAPACTLGRNAQSEGWVCLSGTKG